MKTLGQAGAIAPAVTWGINSDVIELEHPSFKDSVLMVTADREKEGAVGRFNRFLFQRVVGIDEFKDATIGNREFSALKRLRNLVWFEATNCTFDEFILRHERLPPGLIRLSLYDTPLGTMGSTFFSDATSLEILDLNNCDITDSMLNQVGHLKCLRIINLSNNISITDRGIEKLTGLQNLEVLKLQSTSVTSEGLRYIAEMQNLRYVGLLHTQVEKCDIQELQQELPNTQFFTELFGVECSSPCPVQKITESYDNPSSTGNRSARQSPDSRDKAGGLQ